MIRRLQSGTNRNPQSISKLKGWKRLLMYNMHKNKPKKTCKSTINIYLKTINPYDIIKIQNAIDCKKTKHLQV